MARAPPTTGRRRDVPSRSIVISVPGDGQSVKSQAVKAMRAVILREQTASREVQVALARCLIHIDGSVSEIPEDLLKEAR